MITLTASFDSLSGADHAAARLRQSGIVPVHYTADPPRVQKEPTMMIGLPFGYPTVNASSSYSTSLINGLPQTTGNALILNTPFFSGPAKGRVRAQFTVTDGDEARARHILVNSGAQELQELH